MSSDSPTHLGEPRLWSGSDQFAQHLSDAQLRLAGATLDRSALLPTATSVCVSLSLRSVCLHRFSILGCLHTASCSWASVGCLSNQKAAYALQGRQGKIAHSGGWVWGVCAAGGRHGAYNCRQDGASECCRPPPGATPAILAARPRAADSHGAAFRRW